MRFRTRLLTSFVLVVVVPLIVLGVVIPREMTRRFSTEYRGRAAALANGITARLGEEGARIDARLGVVARQLRDDNDVRLALTGDPRVRQELLNFAEREALRTGLAMLQIQNDSGRILSVGHFRNDFDRVDLGLPTALRRAPQRTSLVAARTPRGRLLALARLDSTRLGPRTLTIIGGTAIDADFLRTLTHEPGLGVRISASDSGGHRLELPTTGEASPLADSGHANVPIDSVAFPYIDAAGDETTVGTARFVISYSTAELDPLLRDVRRWILGTILVAVAAALAVALWTSARLSRPLTELAAETTAIDLDKLDGRFASADRDDEVGVLARGLRAMLGRLRASTVQLRDAERRATLGEVARQINHDIKNGLTPIRNVVRHLSEVARDEPAGLAEVFGARRQTLESSIEYLDSLARNYARLSPRLDVAPCEIGPVIEEVVRAATTRGVTVRSSLGSALPPVVADAAVLRRILENLVGNAIDALDGRAGAEVVVGAELAREERPAPMVRLTVSDTGRGMSERELARAFDDFYTTKPGGTGLGLSVVRRLVADIGGVLRVETEPGRGTTVSVAIPVAGGQRAGSGVAGPAASSLGKVR